VTENSLFQSVSLSLLVNTIASITKLVHCNACDVNLRTHRGG